MIADKSVKPNTILKIVVTAIPIKIAPFTLRNIKIIVINNPARPINTAGLVKSTNCCKIPPVETTFVIPPAKDSPAGSPPFIETIFVESETNCNNPKFLIPK